MSALPWGHWLPPWCAHGKDLTTDYEERGVAPPHSALVCRAHELDASKNWRHSTFWHATRTQAGNEEKSAHFAPTVTYLPHVGNHKTWTFITDTTKAHYWNVNPVRDIPSVSAVVHQATIFTRRFPRMLPVYMSSSSKPQLSDHLLLIETPPSSLLM
jgi:hypothetical protein